MIKKLITISLIFITLVLNCGDIPASSQFLGNRERGMGVEVTSSGDINLLSKNVVGTINGVPSNEDLSDSIKYALNNVDSMFIDDYKIWSDNGYLSFDKGNDGIYDPTVWNYFYEGIFTPILEVRDDLNMSNSFGNINLRYTSNQSDTLRWGNANTWVGKIFMKTIKNRPYLTFDNTNLQFDTKVHVTDSLMVLNSNREVVASIDTLGNARFDGYVHSDVEISSFARDSAFVIPSINTWYDIGFKDIHSPYNTSYFTYNSDSVGIICSNGDNMALNVRSKIYTFWDGGNTTVGVFARLVLGTSTGRKYSYNGQFSKTLTKTAYDQDAMVLDTPVYCSTGDTLFIQVRTTDIDMKIQPHYEPFVNVITGSLVIEYKGTW